jgi:hypothetical protein
MIVTLQGGKKCETSLLKCNVVIENVKRKKISFEFYVFVGDLQLFFTYDIRYIFCVDHFLFLHGS